MRAITAIVIGLMAGGCNQLLGLPAPELDDDGGGIDGSVVGACAAPAGMPDEDGDGVRNECDNCPHVRQVLAAEMLDLDGDGIGAACDPHPTSEDRVVAFYTFAATTQSGPALLVDANAGSWSYEGGALVASGTTVGTDMMARLDVGLAAVTIDVDVTLPLSLPTLLNSEDASLGVWAQALPPPQPAPYDPTYPAGMVLEVFGRNGALMEQSTRLLETDTANLETGINAPAWFFPGARYRLVLTCEADGRCEGRVTPPSASPSVLQLDGVGRVGSVGLRSFGVDARFHHLMVYAPGG